MNESNDDSDDGGSVGRPRVLSLDDVMATIRDIEGPAVTTSEVADHLDASKRTTQRRIDELVEQGRLERKQAGARTVIYWIPE